MTHLPDTPYWIETSDLTPTVKDTPPRMAIVPCPAGGRQLRAAIRSLHNQGIESLISLLSLDEVRVLGLEDEGRLCGDVGIDFRSFPVDDHSIPASIEEFGAVVNDLQRGFRAGRAIGAHCFAGIGRSCMLMAGLLCAEGLSADEAFARLTVARGLPVPDTWLQAQWVNHFAESLGKRGNPI
jgi:protein-tyrosine phosphatase